MRQRYERLAAPYPRDPDTRLTNGFSKKFENHMHMIAIYTIWHNFIRVHKTLKMSPAVAAGLSQTLWSMDDLSI